MTDKQAAIDTLSRLPERPRSQKLPRIDPAGEHILRQLAKIYAWVGEKDQAFALLASCAGETYTLDSAVLKLDPDWDSLRGDPRFEKIVASLAPKDK